MRVVGEPTTVDDEARQLQFNVVTHQVKATPQSARSAPAHYICDEVDLNRRQNAS
jgi:hypothetical protein